jgi:hypothetical protein
MNRIKRYLSSTLKLDRVVRRIRFNGSAIGASILEMGLVKLFFNHARIIIC